MVIAISAFSQDIILTTSATEINAKVLEINEETIKYKKFDYQDGPTFTIKKTDVVGIRYQNGTIELFQDTPQNREESSPSPAETGGIIQQFPIRNNNRQPSSTERKYPDMKRFFIYAGVSFPIGRFEKMSYGAGITPLWTIVDNYGGAKIGGVLNVKGRIPVSKNLGITIGGGLYYNGIKDSAFIDDEEYVSYLSESLNEEYGVYAYNYRLNSRSKYINIPLLMGLDYTYMFGKGLGISAELSCGIDFDFITPTVYKNNMAGTFVYSEYDSYTSTRIRYYSAEKLKYVYVPAVHFAYQGNVSFIFGERWSIGVCYYGATKSSIKYDMKETSSAYKMDNSNGTRIYCQKLGISMLMLRLGVGF